MTFETSSILSRYLENILNPTLMDKFKNGAKEQTVEKSLKVMGQSNSWLSFDSCNIMGSAAKETLIKPIDDIDLLCVFHWTGYEKYKTNAQALLYEVRNFYNGTTRAEVRSQKQAVRVLLKDGAQVDIAPVFSIAFEPDVFLLPDGNGQWIRTAPLKGAQWFAQKDSSYSMRLSPFVRLLKAWNNHLGHTLSSFHLETIAANVFHTLPTSYPDALTEFFSQGLKNPNFIDVSDPGGESGLLSSSYSSLNRTQIRQLFGQSANIMLEAECQSLKGDDVGARDYLKLLFGDRLPI